MAYQPLYATISEINGERSTHTCRKKVKWINGWLNSDKGEVMKWHAMHQNNRVLLSIEVSGDAIVQQRGRNLHIIIADDPVGLAKDIAEETFDRAIREGG